MFEYNIIWETVRPLAIFVGGMVVYSLFIFKFYRVLASRDLFEFHLSQYNTVQHAFWKKMFAFVLHLLKNAIIIPVFIFFWFIVLAVLLAVLAKNQTIEGILLVAIAVVGAVRVTSYFSEDLSKDLAKMLPFALLGVFIVDVTFFNLENSLALIWQIPGHWELLLLYLGFIIVVEYLLTLIHAFINIFTEK